MKTMWKVLAVSAITVLVQIVIPGKAAAILIAARTSTTLSTTLASSTTNTTGTNPYNNNCTTCHLPASEGGGLKTFNTGNFVLSGNLLQVVDATDPTNIVNIADL